MDHDELDFLQRIALYPTDAVARGVFADWLDEHDKSLLANWMRGYPDRVVAWAADDLNHYTPYSIRTDTTRPTRGIIDSGTEIPLTFVLAVCGVPPGSVDLVTRVWNWKDAPPCLKELHHNDGGKWATLAGPMALGRFRPLPFEDDHIRDCYAYHLKTALGPDREQWRVEIGTA